MNGGGGAFHLGGTDRLHRKGAELPVVSKELLAPGLVTNLWGRNAVV